jgi:hypothetical protein
MKLKSMVAALGLAALGGLASAGAASATYYEYVGDWQVDQGPLYSENAPSGPTAYTGQEAAALLFGGTSGDYLVSTIKMDYTVGSTYATADINGQAWYSVLGYGAAQHAQDYDNKYNGQYYGPTIGFPQGNPDAVASAYVNDNAIGSQYTNFAFRVEPGSPPPVAAAPEPASWMLMIAGVAGAGLALRQSRRQARWGASA